MKKLFLVAIACLAMMMPANAQILRRIGESAARAAESAVSDKVNEKIREGIDGAFDKNKKDKNRDEEQTEEADEEKTAPQSSKNNKDKQPRTIEAAYAKCDFVPGDEIIFDDDLAGEQLGEFPSKWDLISGVSEVVKFDGKMAFDFQDVGTRVAPLMKNPRNYLTDEFTIECDFYAGDNSTIEEDLYSRSNYRIDFYTEDGTQVCEFDWHTADSKTVSCYYTSTSDRSVSSDAEIGAYLNDGEWNHLSISFNKRAFKAYINGTRVVNIPNMKAPNYLELESRLWGDHGVNFITNVRIAKGAVPLYDRLTTDGKIITYAITFETGKADLKPESMVEIMRIAKLMQDDASLNFEVQGHCDNTGSDKVNDPLSQKRAEAIVAALVEQGIAADRLSAVGKGSHNPIADNSTDEGRAKNRRVEFVKK